MAISPRDTTTSEPRSSPNRSHSGRSTTGLPEKPSRLRRRPTHPRRSTQPALGGNPRPTTNGLTQRLDSLQQRLTAILSACRKTSTSTELTPQLELLESTRMLDAPLLHSEETTAAFAELPHVRVKGDKELPRVVNLAEGYLSAAQGIWSPESLTVYTQQAQTRDPLLLEEITVLPQALRLAQLEYILDRAEEAFRSGDLPPIEQSPFSATLHSMRRLNQFEWRTVLEPLIAFDAILRQDPVGVFPFMEDETRHIYHLRVAELARHADASEVETAQIALDLARQSAQTPDPDPRQARRNAHIGYYLFAEGLPTLSQRIDYNGPPIERLRSFLRSWKEDFYILGIFTLSCLLIVAIIAPLVPHNAFWPVMAALLLALIPASQGAVDLVNNTVTALMKAHSLPKIDFSKGVPPDATTFVVVPTLLLARAASPRTLRRARSPLPLKSGPQHPLRPPHRSSRYRNPPA